MITSTGKQKIPVGITQSGGGEDNLKGLYTIWFHWKSILRGTEL